MIGYKLASIQWTQKIKTKQYIKYTHYSLLLVQWQGTNINCVQIVIAF
jgi:hypothetical protein